MANIPEDRVDQRSQVTRNRMNERPFLKVGLTTADIAKFKENVDLTKVVPKSKKRNVVKRNMFDIGGK